MKMELIINSIIICLLILQSNNHIYGLESCGGLLGKQCPKGYICKYGPDGGAADQPGICIKDDKPSEEIPCGTKANLKCPKGHYCEDHDGSLAWDGPGWCVPVRYCPIGCEIFHDGCNTCNCENGIAECSKRKACTKLTEPICKKEIESIPCNKTIPCTSSEHICSYFPGSTQGSCVLPTCPRGCKTYYDGCNTCTCLPNGFIGACTLMACDTKNEPKCLDKEELTCGGIAGIECPKDEGYWCKITETYPDAMGICTKELCPKGCKTWYDGCNTCKCNNGNAACTKMSCKVYTEPKCLDNEEELKCGGIAALKCPEGKGYWCKVTETHPDAMGICTKELCPKGCASWYDGCNTCGCNNGNPICTEMACEIYKEPMCLDKEECSDEKAKIQQQIRQIMSTIQNMFSQLDKNEQVQLLAILNKLVTK